MDAIDLYQLHAIPHRETEGAVMEALAELRRQGKVKWYGISTSDEAAILRLRAHGPIHVLQIGYNLLEREADGLLRRALRERIGTLIRVPLAKGMLTGKYAGPNGARLAPDDVRYERYARPESVDALARLPQLGFLAEGMGRTMTQAALRFVLDHPGVTCAIAGARTRVQIGENAAASDLPPIPEEERRRALAVADTIRTPGWT
jgi:aryl-alcohol dehydrogenase-like predicted oxidoreductase